MQRVFQKWLGALTGAARLPEGIVPVSGFNLQNYLGYWHEIARLEQSFERGLTRVTAHYEMAPDGLSVLVTNRGYCAARERTKEARGKARFVDTADVGFLQVSFFGPFYGSYVVFDLDADYSRAMVCGPDRSYLWLLAREPKLEDAVVKDMVAKAAANGFDTGKLVFPG
jgi:apolipoprotein D and lipocalin family protein